MKYIWVRTILYNYDDGKAFEMHKYFSSKKKAFSDFEFCFLSEQLGFEVKASDFENESNMAFYFKKDQHERRIINIYFDKKVLH